MIYNFEIKFIDHYYRKEGNVILTNLAPQLYNDTGVVLRKDLRLS